MKDTSIRIKKGTKKRLINLAEYNISMDKTINKLIDNYWKHKSEAEK